MMPEVQGRWKVVPGILVLLGIGVWDAAAQTVDPEPWLRIKAGHFQLYANASPDVALRVARGLEGFRAVFGQLAPELEMASAAPTAVIAFRDAESYAPYRHRGSVRGGKVIGEYSSHPDGNAILLDAGGALLDALAVVYHESVHELIRNNFPNAPLWFHEGLAEHYSTLRLDDEAIEVGAPVERHLAWLRRQEELGLGEVIRLPGSAKSLEETEHVGHFYAVSWLLVHHLISDQDRGVDRLTDFLVALHEGLGPEEAFDAAFPEGVARLEEELLKILRDGTFAPSTVPLAAIGGLGRLEVEPAAPAEVLTRLGFILARKGERDEAERHFDLALKYDPLYSGALAGLGSLRTSDRRLDEAGVWFSEAEESGGLEAESLLLLGRFLLVEAERAGAEGRADDRRWAIEGARGVLQAAAESFPSYVEARALLGMTYLYEGDPEEGIRQLAWARRRAPARKDLAYYLVFLYARAGELERGERLLVEQLDPVEHAQMYQRASEALEQARRRAEATAASDAGSQ